jgi:hypothetical protein
MVEEPMDAHAHAHAHAHEPSAVVVVVTAVADCHGHGQEPSSVVVVIAGPMDGRHHEPSVVLTGAVWRVMTRTLLSEQVENLSLAWMLVVSLIAQWC